MTSKKTTRRALLSSVIALLLCVSMLVGSTFAWFTDSVTSANNVIKSGNLDVTLEYWDGDSYEEVTSTTKLFKDGALWEPGYTEVAYLKVGNAGSLALKYQLGVNVVNEITGLTKDGKEIKLSDHLVFSVVEKQINSASDLYTREQAIAAAGSNKGLKDYNSGTKVLEKTGDAHYVALIIYMPETVGNEANHDGKKAPSIELGVNLFATQKDAESDSFGPDYDKDAWGEGFQVYTAEDLNAALANGETNIVLMADIELTEAVVIPEGATVEMNLNGKALSNPVGYVFENKGNLTIDGNGTVTGMGIIRSTAGKVTIENGNFYASSRWQDGVYQHTLKAENTEVVINGGNFDATVNGQTNAMFNASENGVVTINGGSFKNVAGELTNYDPYIFTYEKNGKVIINDGTFYGGWRFNGETATTDIYGGDFSLTTDGQSFNAQSTHVLNVYGGTFAFGKAATETAVLACVADGYQAITDNGAYTVVPVVEGVTLTATDYAGIYAGDTAKTYYVFDKTGLMNLNALFAAIQPNEGNINTVNLMADVDLSGEDWKPLNSMWIIFNGNGHTVSNLNAGMYDGRRSGFWGYAGAVTINDLTLENVTVNGSQAGIFVGAAEGTKINNCFLKGDNVVNFVADVEEWNGIGAISGVVQNSNLNVTIVEGATVTLNRGNMTTASGCTYIDDLTGHISANNGTVINNGTVTATGTWAYAASTADALIEALEKGEDVTLTADVEINPANQSNGYGKTGINVKNCQTIDGNGNTLDVKGAGGTWDSGISTTGGVIKNIIVTGAFRGIFVNHNSTYSEKVVLENVIIDGPVYTISCDQGTNQGLEATKCTFNGWTSYAATIGNVKFVDCSFGEGSGYAFCRPYAPTEFVNCDFEEGFKMDPRAAVTFENCYLNGVLITAENVTELVTSVANVTVK